VVAAFGSIVAHLLIVILPLLAALTEAEWIRAAIARVDVVDHHKASFLVGVVDSAYAGFFLVWTALFLFVATRSLEARRWR
jgi:large-conductance mechanosensitive channel